MLHVAQATLAPSYDLLLPGQTPLHLAAWRGQLAATRLLCARGAALGALDHRGTSAAGAAAQAGHAEVLELIEAAREDQVRAAELRGDIQAGISGRISAQSPRRSEADAAALACAAAQRTGFAATAPPRGLPPQWVAAALKLAPLERSLIVHGTDPAAICPPRSTVIDGTGLAALAAALPATCGARHARARRPSGRL